MDFHGVFSPLDEVWFALQDGNSRRVVGGRVLRRGNAERGALVGVTPGVIPEASSNQVLAAGGVQFVPLHVAIDSLYPTQQDAESDLSLQCLVSQVMPEIDIELALEAFTSAVEAGFVSANSAAEPGPPSSIN